MFQWPLIRSVVVTLTFLLHIQSLAIIYIQCCQGDCFFFALCMRVSGRGRFLDIIVTDVCIRGASL